MPATGKKQSSKTRAAQRQADQRRARQRELELRRAPPGPAGPDVAAHLPAWPLWVWAWLATSALFFVLRAGGAIRSIPLCFFLSAVAGAFFYCLDQIRTLGPAPPLLRLRQLVLVVVLTAIPSLFDPSTSEIDNLPRLVILTTAAMIVLGTWAVDAVWSGWRPRRLLNGFQWVLAAIVVWYGVTTLTSVAPRLSFLGRDGDYEGFLLIAVLAVLSSGLAESFTSSALPTLFRVIVASTVPVFVYGVIQLWGFDVQKGSNPDFVQWHSAFHNVFVTMGNPNHFGGFLVTVLPIGIATAVVTRHRWTAVALWAWVALAVVFLLQTAARGAWLGGLAGGAILVVGFFPRLRVRARSAAAVAGAALVVAIALIAGGSRFLGAKASELFRFGAGTSVSQRYGYWSAALHLAGHHPLVGTGPDTFADTYTRFQSATLAKELGANFYVNGVHNIFLSWLADEGIPGLALILALFVAGVAWGVRAWRADDQPVAAPGATAAQNRHVVAVALVASLVAYFVQACFDVEQVVTLFGLFLVVGMLGSASRGRWSTSALLRLPLGSLGTGHEPVAELDEGYPTTPAPASSPRRSSTQARHDLRRRVGAVAVAVVALAAVALCYWRIDAAWRADHDARTATETTVIKATHLNPWEPTYFTTLGDAALGAFENNPKGASAAGDAQAAVNYFRASSDLQPDDATAEVEYAQGLEAQAEVAPTESSSLYHRALDVLRHAGQDNPYDTAVRGFEKVAHDALQKL